MNPTDLLQRLARNSRQESVPPVNVVGSVLTQLAARRTPAPSDRLWYFAAGLSSVAAIIVATFAIQMYVASADASSSSDFLGSLDLVLQ